MFDTRGDVKYRTWVNGLTGISGVSQNTGCRRADVAL